MAVPVLSLSDLPGTHIEADVLVLGVATGTNGPTVVPGGVASGLDELLAPLGVTGNVDELTRLPGTHVAARSIALIGLGADAPDANALRRAAGAATRQLRGVGRVVLGLGHDGVAQATALLEGAALGAYSLDTYRSKVDARSVAASEIILGNAGGVPESALTSARATAEAVHLVRDLVNAPANLLTPALLASRAAAEVDALAGIGIPVAARVLEPIELAAEGYGGILSVGQGSMHSPRLVIIEYRPPAATAHVALVGKGITFDTGGLSLKPATSMVGMKYDMTGAATVLGALLATARLGIATNVTAFMCIAENMAGSHAMRPNDVITVKGGTTVEVLNTDAEGRLVLADGLVAASALHPDAIVDVATLTGAARNAFGFRTVPVMGDATLAARLVRVATGIGEDLWRVPLGPEWRPQLKSSVADIANVNMGATAGGMFIAGAFLQDFVGAVSGEDGAPRIPWAHLDVEVPANNEGAAFGFTDKGPTGTTVRTLVALAADLAGGE